MLVQLVPTVLKDFSTIKQLQAPISQFHNIHLGPSPWCIGLTKVHLHHRTLELATQLRAELALVVQGANALQGIIGCAVGQVCVLWLKRLYRKALVVRLQV